ncbi:MAG: hypothetical protein RL594_10 [Bacteroidota bacterium]|jgi:hypothetical protein
MLRTLLSHLAALTLLLLVQHSVQAQVFTRAATPGNWYAYQDTSRPPAGWQTDGNTTAAAGWGLAGVANALDAQIDWLNAAYFGAATTAQNYIWGPTGRNTVYLKYVFDRFAQDSTRVMLEFAVDDNVTIQVNGQTPRNIVQDNAQLQSGWQRRSRVDITRYLQCDENVIAATAINTNEVFSFFIARILDTATIFGDFDVTTTTVDCKDPLKSFTLNATAVEGANYRWTGPNGFQLDGASVTVNAADPLNPDPKAYEGWYVCTATLACGTVVDSVLVRVPLSCCEVGLNVDRLSCNNYAVTIDDAFVDIEAFYWKVDGRVITDTNRSRLFNLGEGTHHICIHYLGRPKSYPDDICCEEVCVTITVPIAERDTITRSYCDFDTYTGLEPSKEFDTGLYSYYILTKTTPPYQYYDSRTGQYGQTWHAVDEGSWTVDYYGEDGCLRKQLVVTVLKTPSDTTYCNVTLTNPCNGEIDPREVMPQPDGACPECYALSQLDVQAPSQHVSSKVDASGNPIGEVYQKRFQDYKNCKVCIFTYEILSSECVINVDFDIVPTSEPFTFTLVNRSSGNGQLVGHTWQVDGFFNHTYLPGQPETERMDFTFRGPGEYRICLNLCNYYCEKECCGKKCMVVRIDGEGRMTIMDRYAPPQFQGPEHDGHTSNAALPHAIIIVPNPTSSVFRLQQVGMQNATYDRVEIMDQSGKVILTLSNVAADHEYNLSDVAKGSYTVRVTSGSGYQHLKLLVQ